MKTATVRDLRLHFPQVEGWLAEGEAIAITKSGKRIATLIKAQSTQQDSLHAHFEQRFGAPLIMSKMVTRLTQALIEDRGQ